MTKRKSYDDKFRASAVVMLEAAGYPDQKGALTRVADTLGVPARTLSRWFNGEQNPPPDQLVTDKKEELADVFERAAYTYLHHALKDDVVSEVSGNAAMIAAATATDKMRLLRGLPTEIVQLLPDVLNALRVLGMSPADVFNGIIQRAAAHQATVDNRQLS